MNRFRKKSTALGARRAAFQTMNPEMTKNRSTPYTPMWLASLCARPDLLPVQGVVAHNAKSSERAEDLYGLNAPHSL